MLLIDTGVLLGAANDTDPAHTACVDLVETTTDTLVTTALVIDETGYLIDRQPGPAAEAGFYRSVANGDILVETLTASDYLRIAELVEVYADFPLGGTDASLIAIGERLAIATVATLDRRHFQRCAPTTAKPSTSFLDTPLYPVKGLTAATPVEATSLTLRVTRISPCSRAVAASRPSMIGTGSGTVISAQRCAMRVVTGRMRSS